ncbi:SPOR domain-containing protein [Rhabdaerophilum sp. SD176]|uniref:SPOR domain-containing protein n=1 Tax=Rhabdaerophilum sp. SD176 TaxID=2983548 RepID=UPI0024E03E96|nr:SPOR domain-containing protein [Rhabdaerophilum sp. SD176]
MDRNDQGRKEPTLADLEAFEKLLRESLQADSPAKPTAPAASIMSAPAAPEEPAALSGGSQRVEPSFGPDQAAMAELARLIDRPVDFALPPVPSAAAPPAPEPERPEITHSQAAHVEGHAEAVLSPGWDQAPPVSIQYAPVEAPAAPAPAPEPLDPLAAFEQELRRFDAIRMAEHKAAQADLRTDYPAQEPIPQATGYDQPAYAEHDYRQQGYTEPAAEVNWDAQQPVNPAESQAEASLHAAEERLAAQAAAAAAAAQAQTGPGRSRTIFLALGGLAVAGGAVLAGSMLFGGGSDRKTASGSVPVIAARPEPTKERPANPGGIEIPNQNKQVLSPRNANDTQPAQVVNNTEQPLDLNQVTRRDGVRVVAPSPYQNSGAPAGETANPNLEPRRVTSIRIPVGGDGAVPTATTTTTAPGVNAPSFPVTPPAQNPAPPPARPTGPVVTVPQTPVNAPIPPIAPPGRTEPAPAVTAQPPAAAQATPPKVETRPTTAQPPRPPASATAPTASPPSARVATAPAGTPTTTPANRSANAPLVLSPNSRPAAPATAARPVPSANAGGGSPPASQPTSGAFAVQLASRPTEEDARNASTQLRTRFSAALGGKAPGVVSGTANGQTVYRVRVGGYSQAAAVEACNKVKAAGGNCFVTRQ